MTEIRYVKNDEAISLYNMNCNLEVYVRYCRQTNLDFRTVDFSRTNRNIGLVVREDILDDILGTIDELKTEIEKLKKEIR